MLTADGSEQVGNLTENGSVADEFSSMFLLISLSERSNCFQLITLQLKMAF